VGIYWLHAGFAGFYSKDAILEAAFARGTELSQFAFFLGIIAALLTSFYSWRLMFLTFWGKPRWQQSEHVQHALHHGHDDPDEQNPPIQENAGDDPHAPALALDHAAGGHAVGGHAVAGHTDGHGVSSHGGDGTGGYHPHESPWSMLVPLILLSLGAVFAGAVFSHAFIDSEAFWNGSIFYDEHLIHALHETPLWVKLSPAIVMLIGLAIAWNNYIRDPAAPARFVGQFGSVHTFLKNKWYFDELYHLIFVRPAFWIGRQFWRLGDIGTIDRFGPNGAAAVVAAGSRLSVRVQSGYLYSYALFMLLGLVAAISWALAH